MLQGLHMVMGTLTAGVPMVTDTNIREGRRSLRLGVQACSFALLLLLPLCFISSAAHAAANPVDGAIAWAQSFLFGQPNYTEGIYTYSGNCQTFVHDAYLHGGGVEIGTPTSYPYRDRKSTRLNSSH